MNKQNVSIEEFRTNLANYVNRVKYGRERVFVKKHNKQAAVLISPEEYESLTDPAKKFTQKEWEEGFKYFEKMKAANADKSPEQIERDIARAVKEVRNTEKQKQKKRK